MSQERLCSQALVSIEDEAHDGIEADVKNTCDRESLNCLLGLEWSMLMLKLTCLGNLYCIFELDNEFQLFGLEHGH